MSSLDASVTLEHADEVVTRDPATWLPRPNRPSGPDAWLVDLHVGPLHRRARVRLGTPVRDATGVHRHLTWCSVEEAGDALPFESLLPTFAGRLSGTSDALVLDGSYAPPIGAVGRIADLALRRLAYRTVLTLLEEIAVHCQQPTHAGSQ